MFAVKQLPTSVDATAPDGCDVRVLLNLASGGLAHFELAPGETSVAVHHRTVEEIWFFVGGAGEMWLDDAIDSQTVPVGIGTCVTIPLGTHFQLRVVGAAPLQAIAVTMPPWPGEGEAMLSSNGPWHATVAPGPDLAGD